jgi:predicted O-methyltransferase YrrM
VLRRAIQRVLRGDPGKSSRFCDFEGRRPPAGAWAYLPRSLGSTLRWKLLRTRSPTPWLGYRAIARIRSLVRPGTRVLEFGAGMSTVWFARRGAEVVSVESDPTWRSDVEGMLSKLPSHGARVILQGPPYPPGFLEGHGFDFALVDGGDRAAAMEIALAAVRPGGHVYLDNADVAYPDHRAARALALARGEAEWFVDFTPFHVFVSTGLLVRV